MTYKHIEVNCCHRGHLKLANLCWWDTCRKLLQICRSGQFADLSHMSPNTLLCLAEDIQQQVCPPLLPGCQQTEQRLAHEGCHLQSASACVDMSAGSCGRAPQAVSASAAPSEALAAMAVHCASGLTHGSRTWMTDSCLLIAGEEA